MTAVVLLLGMLQMLLRVRLGGHNQLGKHILAEGLTSVDVSRQGWLMHLSEVVVEG